MQQLSVSMFYCLRLLLTLSRYILDSPHDVLTYGIHAYDRRIIIVSIEALLNVSKDILLFN